MEDETPRGAVDVESGVSTDRKDAARGLEPADGYNAGYAERLYERRLRERGLVPPSLADWPEPVGSPPAEGVPAGPPVPATSGQLRLAAIAGAIVEAHRDHGHLAVQLDPLGTPPPRHPALSPAFYGVRREELASVPSSAVDLERLGAHVGEVLERLEEIYCGSIGYELDHMENPAQRDWLIDYIESGRHRAPLTPEEATGLLKRLSEVEGFERFLQRAYLGKKRFSIEGLDMMVPMLDAILRRSVRRGIREVFLGMAHRGRLNVLAHIIGQSYESIIAEFEEEVAHGVQSHLPETGAGDVKYHIGSRGDLDLPQARVRVHLAPNPSHLEHVNPVVEGMARAARDREGHGEATCVLPLLIHGDASFAGQGIVAETLNLCRLEGYETGGTLHLIANNQLGFTTLPMEDRSTRYASDLALGFRIPVIHVNADDPEACLAAARLAVDYRFEFGEDLVIDLVGYRRHGHNEADEPGYTQPTMYEKIARHPTVRALWAERLVARGVVSPETAATMADRVAAELGAARERLQAQAAETRAEDASVSPPAGSEPGASPPGAYLPDALPAEDRLGIPTGVSHEALERLNRSVHSWPEDFSLFRKLDRQLAKRREALDTGVDWAHAEVLALASLLDEGTSIRLTGEDTARGTFSQRHLVLHDATGRGPYVPLQHLRRGQGRFEIWNSPLSEVSTLGFEYGFSTVARDWLVVWEAQFGDFVNVGQAVIDQFLSAGLSKWGQESRLVLLLPHGYEGQGPEHSSARPERFLQLAAEGNLRVANCTTPAQYFHLLRLQALRPVRRPLVVLTPKSLLRHPLVRSSTAELTTGGFAPILPESRAVGHPFAVTRMLLCSGKVYYDLLAAREAGPERADLAVFRVEQLYPFPVSELEGALRRFGELKEICWVQEEPANMGAWSFVAPWLRQLAGERRLLRYVGRRAMSSPAEGYAGRHAREQARIVREALGS
ncbi:MAG: 2-oxoglutarate dehydrogenase E1 component [Gemmatimonadota bacterium]